MDEQREGRLNMFGHAPRFKSCPRNHEDPTNTAIHLDGGFFVFGRVFVVNRADGVWQEV